MSDENVILYTVVTGEYDCLASFTPEPSVKYWLFTDNPALQAESHWNKCVLLNENRLSDRRLSRLPKLLPHRYLPPHDISVYIDANMQLLQPVASFATECVRIMPMAAPRHPERDCLYAEADECIRRSLDPPEIVRAQTKRYAGERFPSRFGLTENRFLVRRNLDKVGKFNELWHREYYQGSQRDQLSFMYAVWKSKIPIHLIPQHARHNGLYAVHPHLHELTAKGGRS